MAFPLVMYRCENWAIKKAEHQRIHAFKRWCWSRLLRVPWTARRSNYPTIKESNTEYSLEGLMLKLKPQYFAHLMWRANSLEKDPDAGKDWGQREKGATEDEMVGWHHQVNGHEFEQTPGVGDGQGSLECFNSWGHKESNMTEWLNWTAGPTCKKHQGTFVSLEIKKLPVFLGIPMFSQAPLPSPKT